MFSKSCQYGFQGVLYIAIHEQEGAKIGLREIAEKQDVPMHFLSKILQILVKNKILSSTKGPNGGFNLKKTAETIKLIEIVEAIDGLEMFDVCGIGLKSCSDTHPCPIHHDYKVVKQKIRSLLSDKSLADLVQDVANGKSFVMFKA